MKFDVTHEYDVDGETLFDLLNDEDFLRAKWDAMGHRNMALDLENDGTTFTIASTKDVPADVPGFAKKVLGAWNKVAQVDTWTWLGDGHAEGVWQIDVKGTPIGLSGTIAIAQPAAGKCAFTVTGVVKVSIPLIGGKIADFVGSDTLKSLDADQAFTASYIADMG